jgi:hypothetical protein
MGKTNNFFLSYDAFFVLIIHYGYNSAFEISAFSPIRHSWFRHSRILNSVQLGPTWKSYSRFRNSAFSSIEGLDIQVIYFGILSESWFRMSHWRFGSRALRIRCSRIRHKKFGLMSFGINSVNPRKHGHSSH